MSLLCYLSLSVKFRDKTQRRELNLESLGTETDRLVKLKGEIVKNAVYLHEPAINIIYF